MTYDQARNTTMYEYTRLMRGEAKRREFALHQTRLLASILLQPHAKRGQRIKPTDLFELPGDKEIKPITKRMSTEAIRADIERKLTVYGKRS